MPQKDILKRFHFRRDEKGFSLIEVLLAVALAGIVGLAIPSALSSANKTTIINNERTLAESLARSQMDNIQNQTYDKSNSPPVYSTMLNIPDNYSVTISTARLDPKADGTTSDDGLQQITVTVSQNGKIIYTLVDYKVDALQ